jgi:hypothetical protein
LQATLLLLVHRQQQWILFELVLLHIRAKFDVRIPG